MEHLCSGTSAWLSVCLYGNLFFHEFTRTKLPMLVPFPVQSSIDHNPQVSVDIPDGSNRYHAAQVLGLP